MHDITDNHKHFIFVASVYTKTMVKKKQNTSQNGFEPTKVALAVAVVAAVSLLAFALIGASQ